MQKQNIRDLVKTGLPSLALLALAFLSSPMFTDTARAQQSITEQEAQAIGVEAYIYFYSLVTMDVTRKQISNIEPGKGFGGLGPVSVWSHGGDPCKLGSHRPQE
jgi:hypothetical protein